MKKAFLLTLCLSCVLALTACGKDVSTNAPAPPAASGTASLPENASVDAPSGGAVPETGGDILIAYFSLPEGLDPVGVDAISGASIVVREGEKLGNVQYMAQVIQETAGGDLFRIEAAQEYPLEHDALVDFADEEKDNEARPELTALPEELERYGTVFLGYPNWWADLPMPVYTFLESADLSGKTIIPFGSHGGSGFSRTVDAIAALQPDAAVSEDGLMLSRGNVAKAESEIADWVRGLGD